MSATQSQTKEILGICPQDCPDACGFIYHVTDGHLEKVTGNPNHPFSRGGLCVKLKNYAEHHYHPDRILYPLKRIGKKGEGKFTQVSWDEALDVIRSKWTAIINDYGPTAILPNSYLGSSGLINGLVVGDPFFNTLGASIPERTYCGSGSTTAFVMTYGLSGGVDAESFPASKFIVLWGINTINTNLHHWPFILEARKNGAKIVVIDPTRTKTAKQADWHIRCRPGTDGALAMAMMNCIIEEDLVDHDYVQMYTTGFEELKERVKEYPPEFAAKVTGVPTEDIRQLAREFATHQPSVVRPGIALERHRGGGQTIRAISCLPALVGSWRHPGGGMLTMSYFNFPIDWEKGNRGDLITPGTRVLNMLELGKQLLDETLEPPIKSFFCYNSNPVIQSLEQEKIIKGLERDDLFTVVSELFMTDTARYADIILPASMQAEQFDLMFSWGSCYVGLNRQAIEKPGDTVSNTELFRRLAKTMEMDNPSLYRTDKEIVQEAIDWNHSSMQGITLESLEKTGFARLKIGHPLTRTPHAEGNFLTPSGKVELKSSMAEEIGNFVAPVLRNGSNEFQPTNKVDPLPGYIPPYNSTTESVDLSYPLILLSPKAHSFLNSQFGNEEKQIKREGKQFVLINPADAEQRNIHDDMRVRVFNNTSEYHARAILTDDAMQGTVITPVGFWAKEVEGASTVNSVNNVQFVEMGQAPSLSDVFVEVEI